MLDRLVHSFDLPIGLRSCNRQEDLLDMEVVVELLEFVADELCSIIGYDDMGDFIPTDNVLIEEILDLCGHDGRKCFCFNPLSEVVDSHYCVLHITSSLGKSID